MTSRRHTKQLTKNLSRSGPAGSWAEKERNVLSSRRKAKNIFGTIKAYVVFWWVLSTPACDMWGALFLKMICYSSHRWLCVCVYCMRARANLSRLYCRRLMKKSPHGLKKCPTHPVQSMKSFWKIEKYRVSELRCWLYRLYKPYSGLLVTANFTSPGCSHIG